MKFRISSQSYQHKTIYACDLCAENKQLRAYVSIYQFKGPIYIYIYIAIQRANIYMYIYIQMYLYINSKGQYIYIYIQMYLYINSKGQYIYIYQLEVAILVLQFSNFYFIMNFSLCTKYIISYVFLYENWK